MLGSVAQLAAAAWEWDVLHAINCGLGGPFADAVFLTLQRAIVGVVVMLLGIGLVWDADRRKGLRALVTALVAYGLCMLIADAAWSLHTRVRPGRVAEVVLKTPREIATCGAQPHAVVVRKHVSSRSGMPSRHALSAGVFAATMLLASWGVGLVTLAYALLVALARVYSGVHWPSDVLVGLLVGAGVGALIWRVTPAVWGRVGLRHLVEDPATPSESTEVARAEDAPG